MEMRERPSTYTEDYWLVANRPNREPSPASGKWMLFPYTEKVDGVWDLIAGEVEAGNLGPSAKVASALPNPNSRNPKVRLICVYTSNWRDKDDVRRVLRRLRAIGFQERLSYKTDDDTIAGHYGPGSAIYVSQPGIDDFEDRIQP
jgi:Bles03-like protein